MCDAMLATLQWSLGGPDANRFQVLGVIRDWLGQIVLFAPK